MFIKYVKDMPISYDGIVVSEELKGAVREVNSDLGKALIASESAECYNTIEQKPRAKKAVKEYENKAVKSYKNKKAE